MEDLKFAFTNETKIVDGVTLHRIVALKDFKVNARIILDLDKDDYVHKGEKGGFLEKLGNLSQKDGAWVDDEACVMGNSVVYHNGYVADFATVNGSVQIFDNAVVCNEAQIRDYAMIEDNACVKDSAVILGDVVVEDNAVVCDNAMAYGFARISNNAKVCDRARVSGYAEIKDSALVCKQAVVTGKAKILNNGEVRDNAMVFDNASITEDSHVYSNGKVYGNAKLYGEAAIGENAEVSDYAMVGGWAILTNCVIGKYAKIETDLPINKSYVYDVEKPAIFDTQKYIENKKKTQEEKLSSVKTEKRKAYYPTYTKKTKVLHNGKYYNVTLEYGIQNGKRPYFYCRGNVWKGANLKMDNEFLQNLFPEMKEMLALSSLSSDMKGVPLYAKENSWYYVSNPSIENRIQIVANYLRIPLSQSVDMIERYDSGNLSKKQFSAFVDKQYPRWEKEANAMIEKFNLIKYKGKNKENVSLQPNRSNVTNGKPTNER